MPTASGLGASSLLIGAARDYKDVHPTNAALIFEVSDTTLPYDRQQKKKLYARTEIQEYWIVNLKDRQVEVNRDPQKEDYTQEAILRSARSTTS